MQKDVTPLLTHWSYVFLVLSHGLVQKDVTPLLTHGSYLYLPLTHRLIQEMACHSKPLTTSVLHYCELNHNQIIFLLLCTIMVSMVLAMIDWSERYIISKHSYNVLHNHTSMYIKTNRVFLQAYTCQLFRKTTYLNAWFRLDIWYQH